MGYETKLFVVERMSRNHKLDKIALIDNKVYTAWPNDYDNPNKGYYYYKGEQEEKYAIFSGTPMINAAWCEILGMLEMCKLGGTIFGSICKFEDGDNYMYQIDGNSLVGLDPYGSYRKFVPIDHAIDVLTDAVSKDDYRRLKPALAYLEFTKLSWSNSENLGVLEYGH